MTSLLNRAKEIYSERGPRELLTRGFRQISYQITERFFGSRFCFRTQWVINKLRYETASEPYEIEYIDPHSVQYRSVRAQQSTNSRWKDIGRIMDGDWDIVSKSPTYAIENELLYQAIEAHFERDVPWKHTEYVNKSLESLRRGGHEETWRAVVRNEEDLWERCEQLDELYEQINKKGYKSKREVFKSQSSDPMGYYPRTFKYMIDEIMVDKTRSGEPLLVDGQHRLFLAKVCDVEEIPVLVVVRHKQWFKSHLISEN